MPHANRRGTRPGRFSNQHGAPGGVARSQLPSRDARHGCGNGGQEMTNPEAASANAEVLEVGWHNVVVAYEGVAEEYERMRSAAVVVDRSHRGRIRFFGEKSGEALTGLVTTDVLAIQPGRGGYGGALSAKGRIVADMRILAGTGSYLVDTPAKAWPGFLAMVKKYVKPRVSGYPDESHAIRDLGI